MNFNRRRQSGHDQFDKEESSSLKGLEVIGEKNSLNGVVREVTFHREMRKHTRQIWGAKGSR